MAKQRFRNIKQAKTSASLENKKSKTTQTQHYASTRSKIKAYLTDAFMLIMPIMYLVFYLVMDGREGFAEQKMLGWLYILIPLVITQTIFFYLNAQTPGYKAYNIILIDESTQKKPSLFIILFRNLCAVLSLFTFAWILMFFRKDSKTLHDLLSATAVVYTDAD